VKARALLRLFRPELPFFAGICVLLGQLFALGAPPPLRPLLLGCGAVFLLSAAALILNDYFDLEIDRINAPHRPLPAGLVTPAEVLLLGGIVTVLGLLAAYLLGPVAFLAGLLVWIAGFLYNWRLKRAGLWGNLLVSFSVGMTFVFGGISVGRLDEPLVWFLALIAALFDLAQEITVDGLDIAGDAAAGSQSLAVRYGPQRALQVGAALFLLVVGLTAVPFLWGWFSWFYALPLLVMDIVQVVGVYFLLSPRTGQKRRVARWMYLSAGAGLLGLLLLRLLRAG